MIKCYNLLPNSNTNKIYVAIASNESKEIVSYAARNPLPIYVATKIEVTKETIILERNFYAGKLLNRIELPMQSIAVILEADENSLSEYMKSHYGINEANIGPIDEDQKPKIVEIKETATNELDITDARIVVAVGKGIGSKEKIEMARELAKKLGAAFGSTRPLVDIEWTTQKDQIGQTGRSIKADIYICFGISGAIQHTVGITKSKYIIAVNNDPEAAIFEIADLCIVGDLFEIIPALMKKLS